MTNKSIVGGHLIVPGEDKPLALTPSEVLLGMAMHELSEEFLRVRAAVEALVSDPGNPFAAADLAKAALDAPPNAG